MSVYAITTIGTVRPVLTLSEPQRALRALRPSFRSIHLPLRHVRMGVEGFHRDASGYCLVPSYKDIPVFVRPSRHLSA